MTAPTMANADWDSEYPGDWEFDKFMESLESKGQQSVKDQLIKELSDFVKSVIESRDNRPDGLSSRVRVHEVILIVLLISDGDWHGVLDFPAGLSGILAFCDDQGRRCSGESGFFKALDTETMALLWQRIKGNRTGKYETFARAMRACVNGGYFGPPSADRCRRKRVYQLGEKSLEEVGRLRQTLWEFANQQQQQRRQQQQLRRQWELQQQQQQQ